jgi:hypothetical protein
MAYVKIDTNKNGPYIVAGEVDLIDAALSLARAYFVLVHGVHSRWLHRMVRVKSQIRYRSGPALRQLFLIEREVMLQRFHESLVPLRGC